LSDQTKVSLRHAAKLAGVSRATFYKHIGEKGITIEDKDTARPKVDVSELVRIYGNKLKTPQKLAQEEENKKLIAEAPSGAALEDRMELQALRAENRRLDELRQTEKAAADRYAEQQKEQIELLKGLLESEKEERRRTTVLLTDQRSEKEKQAEKLAVIERENAAMKNAGLFARLFGFRRSS
jgi:hypothetical protein